MRHLLLTGFAVIFLVVGTGAYAMPKASVHKSATAEAKKDDGRAEKIRRSIAYEMHLRGSNIPPAFSPIRKKTNCAGPSRRRS